MIAKFFVVAFVFCGAAVAADESAPVTFNKDVLPILQKNCQTCHRPGQIAPMSFLTLQRGTSVGQGDEDRRRVAQDAAVVRRSPGRSLLE